jgi:hypothetical protein
MTIQPYCWPLCSGLDSEPKAIEQRLARLLMALDQEINSNVVSSAIVNDVKNLRNTITAHLKADAWTMTYAGAIGRLRVKAPPVTLDERLEHIWKTTHKDFRTPTYAKRGERSIIVMREGRPIIVKLTELTRAEIEERMPRFRLELDAAE